MFSDLRLGLLIGIPPVTQLKTKLNDPFLTHICSEPPAYTSGADSYQAPIVSSHYDAPLSVSIASLSGGDSVGGLSGGQLSHHVLTSQEQTGSSGDTDHSSNFGHNDPQPLSLPDHFPDNIEGVASEEDTPFTPIKQSAGLKLVQDLDLLDDITGVF